MTDIIRVTSPDVIARTAALAADIWTEHYTPLIGAEQVVYMLDRFQSAEAIRAAVEREGFVYYLLTAGGVDAGYCGALPEGESLFISKLYVKAAERGKGYSRLLLERALSECPGARRAWLTVNKGNALAIAAYQAMGFVIEKAVVADIGSGFVMDDYQMALAIDGGRSSMIK